MYKSVANNRFFSRSDRSCSTLPIPLIHSCVLLFMSHGFQENSDLIWTTLIDDRTIAIMNAILSEPRPASYNEFTSTQRLFILAIVCLTGIISPLSSIMYTPALPALAQSIGVPISKINLTVTVYLIFGGTTPFFWSGISEVYGRRLVYVLTLLITVATSLGLCFTQSYAAVLALRALHAFGCSSARAIGAGVIRDVFPAEFRGSYMGFYNAGVGAGAAFGPVLGGILAQYSSWHAIFYFLAALSSFAFVCVVLLFPETLRSAKYANTSRYFQPPMRFLCPRYDATFDGPVERPREGNFDFSFLSSIPRYADVFCILMVMGVCYLVWQASMVSTSSLYSMNYHLNEAQIGLTYLSNGFGGLFGNIVIGKLLDRSYEQQRLLELSSRDSEVSGRNSITSQKSSYTPKNKAVESIEKARLRSLGYSIPCFWTSVLIFSALIQARTHVAFPIILSFWISWWNSFIMAPSGRHPILHPLCGALVDSMCSPLRVAIIMVDLFENSASIASATTNLVQGTFGAIGSATIAPMIGKLNVWWSLFLLSGLCLLVMPLILVHFKIGVRCRKQREGL
ncbi:hypothetical protein D9757_003311 [Collybiopsis confluens]|uniref:Major facilitator superfamily (MFS) profile domain-containing protein n=1 Tax=Collybiopsis confluens TaxID=2823264 RepID=A0A8H5HZ47_9AGAR|nr:hypothetical protein D9757_003311 [Collybiopsis confluens]